MHWRKLLIKNYVANFDDDDTYSWLQAKVPLTFEFFNASTFNQLGKHRKSITAESESEKIQIQNHKFWFLHSPAQDTKSTKCRGTWNQNLDLVSCASSSIRRHDALLHIQHHQHPLFQILRFMPLYNESESGRFSFWLTIREAIGYPKV